MTTDQEARQREAEYKRSVAARDAEQAKALLENPMLAKAFAELSTAYLLAWKATTPDDVSTREDAWMMVRALEQLQGHLKAKTAGGRVAAFNLRGALAAQQGKN